MKESSGISNESAVFVGVDPGKKGAIAFYSPQDKNLVVVDWPSTDSESDLFDEIDKVQNNLSKKGKAITACFIEKVSAMPKQGVVSMFNFGQNYGVWRALASFYRWSYRLIPPQTWRRSIVLPSDGKDTKIANHNVACRLFPNHTHLFLGKKGAIKDGRVDAALIAYRCYLENK